MFDRASDLEEKMTALANAYRKPTLPVTGFCHWCSSPCHGAFCDKSCSDDYEQNQKIRGINGK